MKLVFAAPASFLSLAVAVQAVTASAWHFFIKLVFAAPASFLSVACAVQLGWSAHALAAIAEMAAAIIMLFKTDFSLRVLLADPEPALQQTSGQVHQVVSAVRWDLAVGR